MRCNHLFRSIAVAAAVTFASGLYAALPWVRFTPAPGDFPLVSKTAVAPIVYSTSDARVVSIASHDLAADIQRVTGRAAETRTDAKGLGGRVAVLVGTLGHSELIDGMVAARKLQVGDLRGQWESFLITTVVDPLPGLRQALVVVGSDRRGTAYGVYELSQAIGVSPWYWWADVTPTHRDELFVGAGTRRFGPPAVKYRGIFINDEDWGLQPWAAKTFEPEHGDIGPKTYTKLFELMLRLRANTVWPAMHPTTKPFNSFPENRRIADDYAIVMGSSHAEPMLRDNVGEWKEAPDRYNYVTNRQGVLAYWEERMKENGRYENIYTIGMRGVHDSGIQGAKTDAQRIQILEQVFADQRALIAKYARPAEAQAGVAGAPTQAPEMRTPGRTGSTAVESVPQMFCAYKEVLGLYRQGLKVPDDVTIVWPDDNFGYIRNFATAEEQKRSGGFGVYYHLSYLGAPLAYIWLSTTPPELVREEMLKAYDYDARRIWIANVGDLKPAEIGTEFFLQLAWHGPAWRDASISELLQAWAARDFGPTHAAEIAAIMARYYALNFQRRPEHLQWWLPKQAPRPSPLTRAEIEDRLAAFATLRGRADAVAAALPAEKRDAFFELVAYPVRATALANERYFLGELAAFAPESSPEQKSLTARALAADADVKEQTRIYNEQVAGGKWRGFMNLEPADNQWRSFRISKWELPKFPVAAPGSAATAAGAVGSESGRPEGAPYHKVDVVHAGRALAVEAEHFSGKEQGRDGAWHVVAGLGRTGDAVTVEPTTAPVIPADNATAEAPRLDYPLTFAAAGTYQVTFYLLPTQSVVNDGKLRFAVSLDATAPREAVLNVHDGSAEWAQGVLNETRTLTLPLEVGAAGPHVLHVYGTQPGVVLDKIVVDLGGLEPSYFGPSETN